MPWSNQSSAWPSWRIARTWEPPRTRLFTPNASASFHGRHRRRTAVRRLREVVAVAHLRDGCVHDGHAKAADGRELPGRRRLGDARSHAHLHRIRIAEHDLILAQDERGK